MFALAACVREKALEVGDLAHLFILIDVGRRNSLTMKSMELLMVHLHLPPRSQPELFALLHDMDMNSDGLVSYDDFLKYIRSGNYGASTTYSSTFGLTPVLQEQMLFPPPSVRSAAASLSSSSAAAGRMEQAQQVGFRPGSAAVSSTAGPAPYMPAASSAFPSTSLPAQQPQEPADWRARGGSSGGGLGTGSIYPPAGGAAPLPASAYAAGAPAAGRQGIPGSRMPSSQQVQGQGGWPSSVPSVRPGYASQRDRDREAEQLRELQQQQLRELQQQQQSYYLPPKAAAAGAGVAGAGAGGGAAESYYTPSNPAAAAAAPNPNLPYGYPSLPPHSLHELPLPASTVWDRAGEDHLRQGLTGIFPVGGGPSYSAGGAGAAGDRPSSAVAGRGDSQNLGRPTIFSTPSTALSTAVTQRGLVASAGAGHSSGGKKGRGWDMGSSPASVPGGAVLYSPGSLSRGQPQPLQVRGITPGAAGERVPDYGPFGAFPLNPNVGIGGAAGARGSHSPAERSLHS